MPLSFLVLVDTTTQSPWLRVSTAACLVLQDTTVRRKDWPKCLGNARPVSNGVFVYFYQRYNRSHTAYSFSVSGLCEPICLQGPGKASPKQPGRLVGREQRVHIKHGTSQLNTSYISHYITFPLFTPLHAFQHQQQLLVPCILFMYVPKRETAWLHMPTTKCTQVSGRYLNRGFLFFPLLLISDSSVSPCSLFLSPRSVEHLLSPCAVKLIMWCLMLLCVSCKGVCMS